MGSRRRSKGEVWAAAALAATLLAGLAEAGRGGSAPAPARTPPPPPSVPDSLEGRSIYRTWVDGRGGVVTETVNRRFLELQPTCSFDAGRHLLLEEEITNTTYSGSDRPVGVIRLSAWQAPRHAGEPPVWTAQLLAGAGLVVDDFYQIHTTSCCDPRSPAVWYHLCTGRKVIAATSAVRILSDLPGSDLYVGFNASASGPGPTVSSDGRWRVAGTLTAVTLEDTLSQVRVWAGQKCLSASETLRIRRDGIVAGENELRVWSAGYEPPEGPTVDVLLSLEFACPTAGQSRVEFEVPLGPDGFDAGSAKLPPGIRLEKTR